MPPKPKSMRLKDCKVPDRWARKTKQREQEALCETEKNKYIQYGDKSRLNEKLKRKLSEESSEGSCLTLSSPTGLSGSLRTPRELALFMLHPREPHASTSVRSKARGEGLRWG